MTTPNLQAPESTVCIPLDVALVDISTADWTPASGRQPRGLWVTASGLVKVDFRGDGTVSGATGVTLQFNAGVPTGCAITKVYKVGTAATGIYAYY